MNNIRKRLAALSLALLTLLTPGVSGNASEQEFEIGDVTGDGIINTTDALMVLRYCCGLEELTDEQQKRADVDGSGSIDSVDAIMILQYSIGLPNVGVDDTDSEVPVTPDDTDSDDVEPDVSNGFGDNAIEDTSINVSGTNYTVPAGMTLYITADSGVKFGSTNTNVADVDGNGLVLAKKKGTTRIIALKGSRKRTINLTVTDAEPIRSVYTSPNSASLGSTVKLIATTDQTRSAVRFDVNVNGRIVSVNATEKTADDAHGIYQWTGYMTAETSGTFDVVASSEKNGLWTTCGRGKTTAFVSNSSSPSETSLNTLRASDDVIGLISKYEGCLAEAEIDPIAYGTVMNYGYGLVIYGGDMFYNNSSQSECFSDFVNEINEKIYSRYVNEYLQSNGIRYNQYQFDSLVSFVYNLGVYSLQNAGLKSVLLNCYGPSETTDDTDDDSAIVNVSTSLNIRSGPGTNYSIIGTLSSGERVTVLDPTPENEIWIKIKTEKDVVGYCSSNYLLIGASGSERNFNYINQNALINEVLAWHHAGGKCYKGLLYRRIDELEVFLYGDYAQDGYLNKHGWTYPSCIR